MIVHLHIAGSLMVLCAWMVITMQSLHAGHAAKKHAASVSCSPKELTALTKRVVEASLTGFVSIIILCVSTVCLKVVPCVSRPQSSSHWLVVVGGGEANCSHFLC